jgi:hypothetical protein
MTEAAVRVALRIAARGSILYGSEPSPGVDGQGNITLVWHFPPMEVRVRDDGFVNWYCNGQGNEGWSAYNAARPPWGG